jgi:luciferase family oxidoreductase group 1
MSVGYLDLGDNLADIRAADRLGKSVELARRAERLGLARYWMAEHHGPFAALPAPEIALGVIAARTETLRLGAAGVLLRYYRPFKVLENYLMLTQAFGRRFDLGIARGPGASERIAEQLVGGNTLELTRSAFDAKVAELIRLIRAPPPAPWMTPSPYGAPAPDPWILGSSPASAALARELEAPYGFMCFFPSSTESGPATLAAHRAGAHGRPGLIAVSVICADSEREARSIEAECVAQRCFPSNVVGSSRSCLVQLGEIAERYGTRDMVLSTFSPRIRGHEATIELAAAANDMCTATVDR